LALNKYRVLVLAFWLALAAWFYFSSHQQVRLDPAPAGVSADGKKLVWFKGNTHTHARIKIQDYVHGDSSPAKVTSWYKEHGYHFVALTDHNRFEDGLGLANADPTQQSFLVIPAMEVTSDHFYPGVNQAGERRIHATALNIRNAVEWNFEHSDKANIINVQAERVAAQGGLYVLNHPNFRFQVELADILAVRNLKLMEIFNDHPRSNHEGHQGFRPGVEQLWDQALSAGHLIYGFAADDAHDFKWYRQKLRRFGLAPPGGAWIMVRAPELRSELIIDSLSQGDFYASTGVHLKQVSTTDGFYEVELDEQRTKQEIGNAWVRDAATHVFSDDSHFVIEFIGAYGKVLKQTHDELKAGIQLQSEHLYVRARVTYLDKIYSITGADRARAYYAWTQPVMSTTADSN
jgi:hypothetical protein